MNRSASTDVVIAVDAGTGSVRACAIDERGRTVSQAVREWQHPRDPASEGAVDFDTATAWSCVASALRAVTDVVGADRVIAVAASSMREGFVLLDGDGVEVWACPNTDGRGRVQAEQLVASGAADRIYATGGDWVSITAPSRLRWIAQNRPALARAARHLLMLSDWIAYRLSGAIVTEPTCGSSSALFDLESRRWSPELAELVGVDFSILPDVVESGTVIGRVAAVAAAQTGIREGVPVVAGGADTQLALHALEAASTVPVVIGGTFWQTATVVTSPLIDPGRRLRTLCHVGSSSWMIEGIGFLSGLAMRWARDALAPDLSARASSPGAPSAYALMEEQASAIPPCSNGVVAILSDVMQSDAWYHAAPGFLGIDLERPHETGRAAMFRAIEEAAAYVVRAHLDVLDELTHGATASGELVMAGGSSGGLLWPSIVAAVADRRVRRSATVEATSLGAARLAGAAVGMIIPPAPGADADSAFLEPDPADVAAYRTGMTRWADIYAQQRRATRASGMPPLFVPPGALPDRAVPPSVR